jgi:hypothetical protein
MPRSWQQVIDIVAECRIKCDIAGHPGTRVVAVRALCAQECMRLRLDASFWDEAFGFSCLSEEVITY